MAHATLLATITLALKTVSRRFMSSVYTAFFHASRVLDIE
jgi:hypothetical protein